MMFRILIALVAFSFANGSCLHALDTGHSFENNDFWDTSAYVNPSSDSVIIILETEIDSTVKNYAASDPLEVFTTQPVGLVLILQ